MFAHDLETVEVLLKAGVQVNQKNRQGNTSLHAAYAFSPEIIDMLISHGATSSFRNIHNKKPAQCASSKGRRCLPFLKDDRSHAPTCGLYI
jgi:ankyrin repeat protein